MLESAKKKIAGSKINSVVQIILLAVSLITYLIMQFAVGKEALGFAPIWMLFIVYFLVSFIFYGVTGVISKKAVSLVFGGISGTVGLEILLFCVAGSKYWFVWVLIGLIILAITFALTFFLKADKLAIEFDNAPDAGRKTYEQRIEDNVKAESEDKKEEKPLPEIKSFKD